jgi:hypothetical protein
VSLVRPFAAALVICALAPAAQAAGPPPFPHTYRGTISGTLSARDGSQGTTTKGSWTIKNVALRRGHVMKSDAAWSTRYKVTGGTIVYHEAETGSCSYTLDTTLPLRGSLDPTSAPFALSQSFFFKRPTTALGRMAVKRSFKVTETCPQPDGEPAQTSTRSIQLQTLFDPSETRVRLGKRFAGRSSYHDSYSNNSSTIKWSWVLKPGR